MSQILQNTRASLINKYAQVPQLSCGGHYDLDERLAVCERVSILPFDLSA